MSKGGMPNIPGTNPAMMAGAMGGGASLKKKDNKKKGSKSGNPAKRAAENSGLSYGSETTSGSGSSFGLGK
jgi:signal recognition particle subunit SRP54